VPDFCHQVPTGSEAVARTKPCPPAAVLTVEPVTHDGTHHHFEGVRIHPAPAQPGGRPLIVTGRQPVAMRRAVALGDGWMPYLYSPDRYARSMATIHTEAERIGRDLHDFRLFAYVFVSMHDDADRARTDAVEFLGGTYRTGDFDAMIDRVAAVGTVAQVTDRLAVVEARHFVLGPCGLTPSDRRTGRPTRCRPVLTP
jgi:alkanesulfonate monooxygenase SsuD/methylene tetrahydromethanopterin reductase-like flavin-dependent oxidoreductase (luciferase family)